MSDSQSQSMGERLHELGCPSDKAEWDSIQEWFATEQWWDDCSGKELAELYMEHIEETTPYLERLSFDLFGRR